MKANFKSIVGVLFAVGAGVMAFIAEIDNQKKDKKLEDMENRITNLENKGSE